MATVKIYKFKVYDVTKDEMHIARRMATREFIEKYAHGMIIEGTEMEIEADLTLPNGQAPAIYQPPPDKTV